MRLLAFLAVLLFSTGAYAADPIWFGSSFDTCTLKGFSSPSQGAQPGFGVTGSNCPANQNIAIGAKGTGDILLQSAVTFQAGITGTAAANIVEVNSINTYGNTTTLSGSTVPTYLGKFVANWAGTSTATGNTSLAAFNVGTSSDNAAIASGTRNEILVSGNYGGTSFDGFRQGVMVQMNFNTASTLSTSTGGGGGLESKVVPSVNFGGSSLSVLRGAFFGANPWADCKTGATWLSQCVGMEVDVALQTGASAGNLTGLQLVLTSDHATHGLSADNGYALVAQSGASAGLYNGAVVGSYQAQWPIDANGYLYKLETSPNYASVPDTLAGGFDLLQAIFSGSGTNGGNFTFRSVGASTSVSATAIDGSGALKIGSAYSSAGGQSFTLDTSLYQYAGISSIVNGGTNFTGNGASGSDIVDDGYGNLFYVTASAGAVTGLTLYKRAEGRTSAPAVSSLAFNALVETGAALGSGLVVTESTWTQPAAGVLNFGTATASAINIGNSGSTTTITGTIKAGSGTGQSQTCTVNTASALTLIFTNGILTGGTCNS